RSPRQLLRHGEEVRAAEERQGRESLCGSGGVQSLSGEPRKGISRHAEKPERQVMRGMALIAVAAMAALGADSFRDPAPPKVETPPEIALPAAKPTAAVQVHGKPKPLPAGAVTHDWTSFLGPSHNGTSIETKLLVKWPRGGPKLLWEFRKGTGYSSPAI